MNPELVVRIAKEAIEITLYLSLPIMGVGLVVGFIISLFQAVTQMHEITLTFVPKIVAVLLSLLFLMPWMLQKMIYYTEQLLIQLPGFAR
ncbi:MAG: flagellar biosynthesis protein FliQ [Thermodesulfobacteriota bacterium]|nr:flagellar biosynthesis protein FliQ [Deltaproteobacteria bacterium]MDI6762826.1 flagellar biosynthesis protein FliQ [Thermodesulfobacteriota bacterium]